MLSCVIVDFWLPSPFILFVFFFLFSNPLSFCWNHEISKVRVSGKLTRSHIVGVFCVFHLQLYV
ncbi:hypothetical protein QR685DRAFT_523967 [Neurospora intermedia]|uniref:Secreted protein n=1 Tax=Neurospora intermedia TaxID=5142 RepID=A0ABR3DD10_NEUIN